MYRPTCKYHKITDTEIDISHIKGPFVGLFLFQYGIFADWNIPNELIIQYPNVFDEITGKMVSGIAKEIEELKSAADLDSLVYFFETNGKYADWSVDLSGTPVPYSSGDRENPPEGGYLEDFTVEITIDDKKVDISNWLTDKANKDLYDQAWNHDEPDQDDNY